LELLVEGSGIELKEKPWDPPINKTIQSRPGQIAHQASSSSKQPERKGDDLVSQVISRGVPNPWKSVKKTEESSSREEEDE
jgi:hypothetical protein